MWSVVYMLNDPDQTILFVRDGNWPWIPRAGERVELNRRHHLVDQVYWSPRDLTVTVVLKPA